MTQAMNNYDKLYNNMKQRFTVSNENEEYSIGEYMLMKADVKKTDAALPVAMRSTATNTERAVANIVTYVNDISCSYFLSIYHCINITLFYKCFSFINRVFILHFSLVLYYILLLTHLFYKYSLVVFLY